MVESELQKCPKCGAAAASLVDIDKSKRLILADSKLPEAQNLPAQVCGNCYSEITSLVSKGAKLRLERESNQKNKHMLWKSRVNVIKQARALMQQKAYSEAAITYEKYLRILEIAYELKPGGLTPEVFGKSAKSKELTVIATTYWDLMRIYDTNKAYRDRMMKASAKLAEFLPFSPIFPAVTEKAREFSIRSKNPDIVRGFLRKVKANSRRCFIATAAFESPDHKTVVALRAWRDHRLEKSNLGRAFVSAYYRFSPPVAAYLDQSPLARKFTRKILSQFAHSINKNLEQ